MAVTITNLRYQSEGSQMKVEGTLTFDTSYPTGGEAITAVQLGMARIDQFYIEDSEGYTYDSDIVSGNLSTKIVVYDATASGAIGTEQTHVHPVALDGGSSAAVSHTHADTLAVNAAACTGTSAAGSSHTHADTLAVGSAACAGTSDVGASHTHADTLAVNAAACTGTSAVGASHVHAVGSLAITDASFTGSSAAVSHNHADNLAINSAALTGSSAAVSHTHADTLAVNSAALTGTSAAGASHTHAIAGVTNAVSDVTAMIAYPDGAGITKPVIALTHNADPVANLAASLLFVTEAYELAGANVGILQSNCAGTTSISGETANGTVYAVAASTRFWVTHNATPTGVQIYVNEGAADQLECISPTGADCYVMFPFESAAGSVAAGCAVKITHNASADSGKVLYFDDNGAADAQLVFIDAGAGGGVIPAADILPILNTGTIIGESSVVGVAAAQGLTGNVTAEATHTHAVGSLALNDTTLSGSVTAEAAHVHAVGTLALNDTTLSGSVTAEAAHVHGVGTFALTTAALTGSADAEAAHTHAVGSYALNDTTLSGSVTAEATHTHAVGSIALNSTALTGSVTAEAAHTHAVGSYALNDLTLSGSVTAEAAHVHGPGSLADAATGVSAAAHTHSLTGAGAALTEVAPATNLSTLAVDFMAIGV